MTISPDDKRYPKKGSWVQRLPEYRGQGLWPDLSRRLGLPEDHIYRCVRADVEPFWPGGRERRILLRELDGKGTIGLDARNFVAVPWWEKLAQWLRRLM